jgi:hypothetical protein
MVILTVVLVLAVGLLILHVLASNYDRREDEAKAEAEASTAAYLAAKAKRADELMTKYGGDEEAVERIESGEYWQGMTMEQLRDSLGPPDTEQEQVLKTKTKQVWTYKDMGSGYTTLRVTMEGGVVTGWTSKESNT